MGEIVNLNRHRKRAERAGKERGAAVNRARSGLSREAKHKAEAERARKEAEHDGKRLEPGGPDDGARG
jgi:hypothetical protein